MQSGPDFMMHGVISLTLNNNVHSMQYNY